MRKAKLIAALILTLLCIVVVLQNTETVETRLLFATVAMPRAFLLLVTALFGFAVGILAALLWLRKKG